MLGPCSVAEQQKNCQDSFASTEVRAALDAGHVRYDPVAAAALVARLDSRPPDCRDSDVVLGLKLRNAETLAGTFVGTLAPGSPCTLSSGIAPSDCVPPARCVTGMCTKPVFFGDPCVTGMSCLNPDAYPNSSDYDANGACVTMGATSICSPPQPVGATCGVRSDCISAQCMAGRCAAQLPDGATCSDPHECLSGACDQTCHTRGTGAPGSKCTINSDCTFGNCDGADGGIIACGPPPLCYNG